MSTVKLYCKIADLANVMADMMKSGVKYYPVRHAGDKSIGGGYIVEMNKDHYIVPFLILKYDLKTLSDEHV